MNTKNIILGILGLGIVIGLGFFAATKKEQKNIEEPIITPTEPIETPPNQIAEFGKSVAFTLNNKITFSDGLEVTLKEINDSRCPEGVQCIWMGEISGFFSLSGGELPFPKEIRLGTVNNKDVSFQGYAFSLKSATKNSILLEVVKN